VRACGRVIGVYWLLDPVQLIRARLTRRGCSDKRKQGPSGRLRVTRSGRDRHVDFRSTKTREASHDRQGGAIQSTGNASMEIRSLKLCRLRYLGIDVRAGVSRETPLPLASFRFATPFILGISDRKALGCSLAPRHPVAARHAPAFYCYAHRDACTHEGRREARGVDCRSFQADVACGEREKNLTRRDNSQLPFLSRVNEVYSRKRRETVHLGYAR